MKSHIQDQMPGVFLQMIENGDLSRDDLFAAKDGFCAARKSLADILCRRDILTVPGDDGRELECRLFFDDWYLYAVNSGTAHIYGLFKMREQEYDLKMGLIADGDIPGVTISFIEMNMDLLLCCLQDPTAENRRLLNREINRVVAAGGQIHSKPLRAYFIRTEACGAYLVARLYTDYIASLAEDGVIPVPECYAQVYGSRGRACRTVRFIDRNNALAGRTVCDHEKIEIQNAEQPSKHERLAILATHTGNTSFFSFASEVQFHARFLTWWTRLPLPIIGRAIYASAIRADMSIGDAELIGPTPYYRENSRIMKRQIACHAAEGWIEEPEERV